MDETVDSTEMSLERATLDAHSAAVSAAISQRSCATVEEDDEPHELDEPSENLVDDEAMGVDGDDELDIDVDESSDLSDEEADKLDIGGIDVHDDAEGSAADADAPLDGSVFDEGGAPTFADEGVADDEAGPMDEVGDGLRDDALPMTADDGGAEGLSDGSETILDEGLLPAMDAGVEGDFELNDLLSEMGLGGDDAWEVAPAFGSDVSLAAVSANDGVVVGAGAAAVVISAGEQTSRVRPLEQAASHCVTSGGRVFLATGRGVEMLGPGDSRRLLAPVTNVSAIAIAAEQLFVLADGALVRVDIATGKSHRLKSGVTSIGASDGTLFAANAESQLERLRGHDGDFERCTADAMGPGPLRILGCAPKALLLADGEKAFRVDDRFQARTLEVEGAVAGAPFSTEELLVLSTEPGAFAVSLVDKLGEVRRIARVAHTGEPPVALAWDASRELIFVAGPAGLLALQRRLSH